MNRKKLNGPSLVPDTTPEQLVVMLHGYGADGNDLIGLAPFFQNILPNAAFHSPDGPEICEMSPFGRQWFSLERTDPDFLRRRSETQDIAFESMYEGAIEAAPLVQDYVNDLQDRYNITSDKTILIGFSQGTMMALHLGLRQKQPFGAIVGFSGALVGASHLAQDVTSRPPIMLIHGEADEMLPVKAVELAETALQENHINLEVLKIAGLPHSIDQEGALAAAQFIKKHL